MFLTCGIWGLDVLFSVFVDEWNISRSLSSWNRMIHLVTCIASWIDIVIVDSVVMLIRLNWCAQLTSTRWLFFLLMRITYYIHRSSRRGRIIVWYVVLIVMRLKMLLLLVWTQNWEAIHGKSAAQIREIYKNRTRTIYVLACWWKWWYVSGMWLHCILWLVHVESFILAMVKCSLVRWSSSDGGYSHASCILYYLPSE